MILVGRLVGKVDGRYLIMIGFCIVGISTYVLSDINLQISIGSIAWPQVWSGFALGFVFVPLTGPEQGTTIKERKVNWSEPGIQIPCPQDR